MERDMGRPQCRRLAPIAFAPVGLDGTVTAMAQKNLARCVNYLTNSRFRPAYSCQLYERLGRHKHAGRAGHRGLHWA